MTTYRIAEVAGRTGFSPPTLRYYEEIGLLPPASRTAGGYRTYDERAIDRLAFIRRAKELGCSLEEIADLAAAWERDECEPVQHRLRALVAGKVADAEARITELIALTASLRATAVALESAPLDGPCTDSCGCTSLPDAAPIACTLGAGELQDRVGEWQAVLVHVVERTPIAGGIRTTFAPSVPLAEVVRLVEAERGCCAFFSFAITVDDRGVALEATAPADGAPMVEALFGQPVSWGTITSSATSPTSG